MSHALIDTGVAIAHQYPEHSLTYPNDQWVCDAAGSNGVIVPKKLKDNLKFRVKVARQARNSRAAQIGLWNACRDSPEFFLNTFAMTYRPKYTCIDGKERNAGSDWVDHYGKKYKVPGADAPIITWPAQDKFVQAYVSHIMGRSKGPILLCDKSREQGATVLSMYMLAWSLLFYSRFTAAVVSRKKDMVDSPGEESLFGKLDYLLKKLPEWMANPEMFRRTHGNTPHLINNLTNSQIMGETANKDVLQSNRCSVVLIDEASRFPYGKALRKSVASVTAFELYISTPDGPGTEFSNMVQKAMTPEGKRHYTLVRLGYWDHPEMGRGRELVVDVEGEITGKKGAQYWTTPAFVAKKESGTNIKDLRENWLIDHDTSGLLVLDSRALSVLKAEAREPLYRGGIDLVTNQFYEDPDGKLLVYVKLDAYGALPVNSNYVLGGDIAQGVEKSNSVLAIASRETGEVVAEFVCPSTPPQDLAAVANAMGLWASGQRGCAFIIWERNGPGLAFGHEIVGLGYPMLYYQRTINRKHEKRTRNWGWQSTGDSKEIMFKELNKALTRGKFSTPSLEGVYDMQQWLWDDNGKAVCGALRDESTGAQQRHGDRAIAYGMCVMGMKEVIEYEDIEPTYKEGTMGKIAKHTEAFQPKVRPQIDPFAIRVGGVR